MNFHGVKLFASHLFHHSNLSRFIIYSENRAFCSSSILKFEAFVNNGRKIKIIISFWPGNQARLGGGEGGALWLAQVLNHIFLSEITYLGSQARQAGFPSSILKLGWGIVTLEPSQFQCKSVLFGKASQIAFIQHLDVQSDLQYSPFPF